MVNVSLGTGVRVRGSSALLILTDKRVVIGLWGELGFGVRFRGQAS